MLDWVAWTLTHSSGAAELAGALELVPPLGLVAMRASREAAVVVAEPEDVDAEPVPVDELVPVEELVWAGDADVADADAEDPLVDGVTLGEGVGEGVGDGDGEVEGEGDGDGDGEDEATAGSAWHTGVGAAAACSWEVSGAACALPSAPRVRKPPLSAVTAATRTCPRRIRIACLRRSSGLPCAVGQFGGERAPDGYLYSYPSNRLYMHHGYSGLRPSRSSIGPAGREPEAPVSGM
jgi:hypothetical protein